MTTASLCQAEVEAIRRQHLEYEANLRSLEYVSYLWCGVFVLLGFVFIGRMFYIGFFDGGLAVGAIVMGLLAGFCYWTARQFKRLTYAASIIGSIAALSILCLFPLGTALSLRTLWSIFCTKGRYVFTKQYHKIITATPDIKCRPGGVLLLAYGFVFVFMALIVIAVIFDYHPRSR